jgi:uncharacterized protein
VRRLDLRSLRFGDASEVERRVPVDVDPLTSGGLDYAVSGGSVELALTASRVGVRMTVRGTGVAHVTGPCVRCLDSADLPLRVECVEYVNGGETEGDDDEPYTRGGVIDLSSWVRDAIAEALPGRILCRDDCRGLCPVCGADLNTAGDDHTH